MKIGLNYYTALDVNYSVQGILLSPVHLNIYTHSHSKIPVLYLLKHNKPIFVLHLFNVNVSLSKQKYIEPSNRLILDFGRNMQYLVSS